MESRGRDELEQRTHLDIKTEREREREIKELGKSRAKSRHRRPLSEGKVDLPGSISTKCPMECFHSMNSSPRERAICSKPPKIERLESHPSLVLLELSREVGALS